MSDFNRLLEEQIPRLRRYARALTRNIERADHLVQDTLIRALTKQHLWQAGTNLRAWLFTLMHNQNINTARRSIRESQMIDVETMSNVLAATTDPNRFASAMRTRPSIKSAGPGAAAGDIASGSRRIFLRRNCGNSQCAGGDRAVAAVTGSRPSAPTAGHARESPCGDADRRPAGPSRINGLFA